MKSLLGKTKLPFDVHLMITDPDRYIKDFVTENTEIITVHQEACIHLHRTLQMIKSHGVKAGVSLNPATPLLRWNMSLKIGLRAYHVRQSRFRRTEVYPVRAGKNQKTGGNEGPAQSGSDYRRRRRHHIGERRRCGGRGANLIVAGSSVFGAPDVKNAYRISLLYCKHRCFEKLYLAKSAGYNFLRVNGK